MNEDKNLYETQSLSLAATLISLGINLDSVIKDQEDKSTFIFLQTKELDQVIELFWKRELKVEPNSFWESLRFIKSRIYGD